MPSGGEDLADVLVAVADIPGIDRVRLSSAQPVEIPDKVIDAIATHPNIADKLRAVMPRIGLTTDLIVGYPGETLELFENTLTFARKMQFARTYLFWYSPRQRTAVEMLCDDVSHQEKGRRHKELTALCVATREAFAAGDLGRVVNVLVEAKGAQDAWLSVILGITFGPSSPHRQICAVSSCRCG